jgi:hypothetical protein
LNSISEVTVTTLSYAVDQGRYGASQVNYVTKSGSNQFHGNVYELWNGSKFSAANYFTKQDERSSEHYCGYFEVVGRSGGLPIFAVGETIDYVQVKLSGGRIVEATIKAVIETTECVCRCHSEKRRQ